jgi:antitoxin VapB
MNTAKLFTSGNSQAVRLPKEYRFEGTEVFIKRVGNAIILLPYHEPWQSLIESLDEFPDDFMESREQPADQERESIFP